MRTAKTHGSFSSSSSSSSGVKKNAPAKIGKLPLTKAPASDDDMEADATAAKPVVKKRSGADDSMGELKRTKSNALVTPTPAPVLEEPGAFDDITDEDLAVADAMAAAPKAQAKVFCSPGPASPSVAVPMSPPHHVVEEEQEPPVGDVLVQQTSELTAPSAEEGKKAEEKSNSKAEEKKPEMKTKSFDEYLKEYFGVGSDHRIYYEALTPEDHFTLSLYTKSPDEIAAIRAELDKKRAARKKIPKGQEGEWKDEDEDNYNAQKEAAGRTLSLRVARGVHVSQVEWSKQADGKWQTSFLGRPLQRMPEALIMPPLAQFEFPKLGKFGDMFVARMKKNPDGSETPTVKRRFEPGYLEDASYTLAISDKPLERPGYTNTNNRNPHMVKYFRFVRLELLKKGILQKMWASDKLCEKIRTDVLASLNLEMARELMDEDPNLAEKDAEAKLETDPVLVALKKQRFLKLVMDKHSTVMVKTNSQKDKRLNINFEQQYFKRPIFRKTAAKEKEEIRRKLSAGEFNHLPPEYVDVLAKANGDLAYNHLFVFRHKTAAEMKPELWKKDPYPWIELTWEEREQISWATVGTVVYEVPLREYTPQRCAGPMAAGNLIAVFIAAFDKREGANGGGASGTRREAQRAPPEVLPEF
jgi:hypothetical protein